MRGLPLPAGPGDQRSVLMKRNEGLFSGSLLVLAVLLLLAAGQAGAQLQIQSADGSSSTGGMAVGA